MAKLPPKKPTPTGQTCRLGIVTSEFNEEITNRMREDALKMASSLGAKVVVDARVPGVFDIPLVLSKVLSRRDVDGGVAIGAVITGETRHDEVVAFECASRVAELALRSGKPIGFGVTGPGQDEAQAAARIDRGGWAVRSVCSQFKTLRDLR